MIYLLIVFINGMKSISKANGTFGYNCGLGKCDFIQAEDSLTSTARLLSVVQQTIIPFLIPGLITIFSYTYLWYHVRKSQEFMKKNGSRLYSGITFVTSKDPHHFNNILFFTQINQIQDNSKRTKHNSDIVFGLLLLFSICWPYGLIANIEYYL